MATRHLSNARAAAATEAFYQGSWGDDEPNRRALKTWPPGKGGATADVRPAKSQLTKRARSTGLRIARTNSGHDFLERMWQLGCRLGP